MDAPDLSGPLRTVTDIDMMAGNTVLANIYGLFVASYPGSSDMLLVPHWPHRKRRKLVWETRNVTITKVRIKTIFFFSFVVVYFPRATFFFIGVIDFSCGRKVLASAQASASTPSTPPIPPPPHLHPQPHHPPLPSTFHTSTPSTFHPPPRGEGAPGSGTMRLSGGGGLCCQLGEITSPPGAPRGEYQVRERRECNKGGVKNAVRKGCKRVRRDIMFKGS